MNFVKYFFIFLIGGTGYYIIETLFRGFSHWTMFLTGGACLLTLYVLNSGCKDMSLFKKALIGAAVITAYEFSVGVIVNLWFDWGVWDYSNQPGHILGQICPLYFLCWVIFCFFLAMVYPFAKTAFLKLRKQ